MTNGDQPESPANSFTSPDSSANESLANGKTGVSDTRETAPQTAPTDNLSADNLSAEPPATASSNPQVA
ncbi:MAG: hypothetical protein ACPHL6_11255, partial [Rubripirellula sp.]